MGRWHANALVFATSAAVLVLEIIAGRLMAPYVGISIETFTGIIGTVLAGIAVGAAVGGRIADRAEPRLVIGPALLLGGALSWAALPILTFLGPAVGDGPAAIVILTACCFFLPVMVLSAVSPMVAKLRLATGRHRVRGRWTLGRGDHRCPRGHVHHRIRLVAAMPSRPVVWLVGGLSIIAGVVLTWRLNRKVPSVGELALVLAVGVGAGLTGPPCDVETAYFCARVETDPDRPSGRSLWLDNLRHAYVDLDDPTVLESRYVRLFADVVADRADGPLDVLHIGGGGFTFPRYLAHERPGSDQTVLEIDDELPRIARDRLGLSDADAADFDIRIGDARLALDDFPRDRFDLVVGDAFASKSVPWHLTTSEVAAELDRILRDDGIYVMNVIDGGDNRFARAELATLAEHFTHVAAMRPPDDGGALGGRNTVLVASDAPIPEAAIAAEDGQWTSGDELRRFVDDAAILRDDHAPVDQLIAR